MVCIVEKRRKLCAKMKINIIIIISSLAASGCTRSQKGGGHETEIPCFQLEPDKDGGGYAWTIKSRRLVPKADLNSMMNILRKMKVTGVMEESGFRDAVFIDNGEASVFVIRSNSVDSLMWLSGSSDEYCYLNKDGIKLKDGFIRRANLGKVEFTEDINKVFFGNKG